MGLSHSRVKNLGHFSVAQPTETVTTNMNNVKHCHTGCVHDSTRRGKCLSQTSTLRVDDACCSQTIVSFTSFENTLLPEIQHITIIGICSESSATLSFCDIQTRGHELSYSSYPGVFVFSVVVFVEGFEMVIPLPRTHQFGFSAIVISEVTSIFQVLNGLLQLLA